METFVRTPAGFFLQPQRFEIPLFQRPYVWSEELEVGGQRFRTPSGAANKASGKSANGWIFRFLPDGRRLADVRGEYIRSKHASAAHGTQ